MDWFRGKYGRSRNAVDSFGDNPNQPCIPRIHATALSVLPRKTQTATLDKTKKPASAGARHMAQRHLLQQSNLAAHGRTEDGTMSDKEDEKREEGSSDPGGV